MEKDKPAHPEAPVPPEPAPQPEAKQEEKKFTFDRTWIIDKVIELSIFILGFVIALWIDGIREDGDVRKLKQHYIEIVQADLEKDRIEYETAYAHDSLRAAGCDYILKWLLKRQKSAHHSYGILQHNSKGRIGPGFQFDAGPGYKKADTIQIISEKSGWLLDTSGYWHNGQIVRKFDNDFTWFSAEVNDSVVKAIKRYGQYVDVTQSVFQHHTGYEGLMSQNTSSFLNTSEIESRLSDYYSFGDYLQWLEDYYRDTHFGEYSALRYSYGNVEIFRFLYLLNNEQNNELIRHLTLASIYSKKEMKHYRTALQLNKDVQELLAEKGF